MYMYIMYIIYLYIYIYTHVYTYIYMSLTYPPLLVHAWACQTKDGTFNTASFFLATRFACRVSGEAMGYQTSRQCGNHSNQNMKGYIYSQPQDQFNYKIEFGRPRITTSSIGRCFDPLIFVPLGLGSCFIWRRKSNYSNDQNMIRIL